MLHQNAIKGVSFTNNPHMVEHQWFPVEYFSGSDVTIYFGDTFLSECSGLQFGLEERVQPIHGYGSYTWDCVSRGTRLVTGSFEIPLTDAGYLDAILMHIGQYTTETEKVKPKMAYKMAGKKVPGWCADYKMDVEGLFDKFDPGNPMNGGGKKTTVTPGANSSSVSALNRKLSEEVGYIDTPISTLMTSQYGRVSSEVCKNIDTNNKEFVMALQETINLIFEKDQINRFASKTSQYIKDGSLISRKLTKLNVDGIYDSVTSDALGLILNWFGYNSATRTSSSSKLYEAGDVIDIEPGMMELLTGLTQDSKYDAQTFLQLVASDLSRDGNVEVSLPTTDVIGTPGNKPNPTFGKDGNLTRWEDRTARYESEIWGRDFSGDVDRRYNSFFYTDRYRNAGLNGERMLKKYGFDIYITYGPAADAQRYAAWQTKKPSEAPAITTYTFKTTVKAVRNVQITSNFQRISPNGQPIAEVFNFIASDID